MNVNASERIDQLIRETDDWRGAVLAKLRKLILGMDPGIVEDWKYMGTPVFSKNTTICVMNPHKGKVKVTFSYGAALKDPNKLFNTTLGGSQWRAIDFLEGDKVDERALKALLKEALAHDATKAKKKPSSQRKSR
jgi:hypothetical protein